MRIDEFLTLTNIKQLIKKRLRDLRQYGGYYWREVKPFAGKKTSRMLFISDFNSLTSDQQYAPIMRNAGALRVSTGLNPLVLSWFAVRCRGKRFLRKFDAVGFKLIYRTPEASAYRQLDYIRNRTSDSAKLLYFDGDDDLNVQWPRVLRNIDVYVKKHVFAESSSYQECYRGKSNLTDFVSRTFGDHHLVDTTDASGPLVEDEIRRIALGWNIGLDDGIYNLFCGGMVSPRKQREIQVCGRATAGKADWVVPLREPMRERLEAMANEFKVAIPHQRVPPEAYFHELRCSQICVSPFGYGEICWRDFEAIVSGCLLVKPDMSHLRTEPNIYNPGVTYVPVAWDFSNLAEVCSKYLADDALRFQIVTNAQTVLAEAMAPEWLANRLESILSR